MPWLTVITVVKDDIAGFLRSRDSLLQQNTEGIQWIVIDSSVNRDAIRKALAGDRIDVVVEWTRAQGIYPAMNTGLGLATGDYVYFLNAGDEFSGADVLSSVREALGGHEWAFGPVAIVGTDGTRVVTPPWDYQTEKRVAFSRGLFPAHQGTIASTELVRSCGGFDERFTIAADYALFLRMSLKCDPIELTTVIATFHEGGASTSQWQESFKQFHRARKEVLAPSGALAVRERWETAKHFGLVYAHREIRPRLQWRKA